ncbi:membrane protein [Streptomyces phage Keanu]|nr:membrane protein [Streptomyces phage Keanu]
MINIPSALTATALSVGGLGFALILIGWHGWQVVERSVLEGQ